MPAPAPAFRRGRLLPAAQARLVAAIAAAVALVGVASGVVAERRVRARELAHLERALERDALLVRELVGGRPLTREASTELQELALRASRAASGRITLVAPDGSVVADSDVADEALAGIENHAARPEVAAALAGRIGRDERRSATVGRRFLYLGVPAGPRAGGGAIRLAVDLSAVEREAAALRRDLLAAALLGLAVVVPLALWLSRVALRPLREVAEAVARVAEGDLERRLPRAAGDDLGRIAAAVNEMAEQLRARLRELVEDKERLQAVLSGMVEGVLVVDAERRVVLANPRLRELFSFRGDAAGRDLFEVVRRADLAEALDEAARGGGPVVRDLETSGPEPRQLELHAVRFPTGGALLGVVAVLHDVTELHRLERMRRDFVANVSHELKTPLTAIRGFAETLAAGGVPEAERRSHLDVVLRHAERLARLIDDLLELSRIEGQRGPLERTEVDVARAAALALRDLAPQLEARGLRASLAAGACGRACADRRAVEQILANLLDNACKYTEPGGRIEVRIAEAGGRVRVEVEDSGIGIPPEDLPRVFERFYRVDKARSRDLGGTGLGLAIVKHLVQALGGQVSVRSAPGSGSTFTVLLPAV
jgi:two-component system phosphate regulon sensor histidine kinase PhoR